MSKEEELGGANELSGKRGVPKGTKRGTYNTKKREERAERIFNYKETNQRLVVEIPVTAEEKNALQTIYIVSAPEKEYVVELIYRYNGNINQICREAEIKPHIFFKWIGLYKLQDDVNNARTLVQDITTEYLLSALKDDSVDVDQKNNICRILNSTGGYGSALRQKELKVAKHGDGEERMQVEIPGTEFRMIIEDGKRENGQTYLVDGTNPNKSE